MTGTPNPAAALPTDDCCLPDIRISELDRVRESSYDDLLVIDRKRGGADVYDTKAITWGHLTGVYPPGYDPENPNGGDDGNEINNEIILRGQVKFLDGTELRPSITFIKDDNTGIYRPGSNTIGFTTGGSRTVVMAGDSVGIGTDFPAEKLHIHEGNILVFLGIDDNALFIGSSNRTMGGNPSIQSHGEQPLTFHTNFKQQFMLNMYGAWGIREDYMISDFAPMKFGTPGWLLASRGETNSPEWTNPADLWDLSVIIEEIDQNYIGKGPLYVYPQPTVVGSTNMSPGLDYTVRKSVDGEDPNANVFREAGWELNVDDTVVRTDGEQYIKNTKHFHETGVLQMERTTAIINKPESSQYFHNESTLTLGTNAHQILHNKSEFLFELLDWIGDAP